MKNKLLFIFLMLCGSLSMGFLHDYHVTIFEINYDKERDVIEMIEKVFIDDLEKALLAEGASDLRLGHEKEHPKADEYIANYLKSKFSCYKGETKINFTFLGKEWEDHHTIWCYFEAKGIPEKGTFRLVNETFTDLFDDQQNMHHFTANELKKSIVLTPGQTEAKIAFDGKKND